MFNVLMNDSKLVYVLVEAIPIIALVLFTMAYRLDCGRKCALVCVAGEIVLCFYSAFIGAWMGLMIGPLAVIRSAATAYASDRMMHCIAGVYILAAWGMFFARSEFLYDFLPIIATSLGTYSLLCRDNPLLRNMTGIVGSMVWMSYYACVGGVGGALLQVIFIASTVQASWPLLRPYFERRVLTGMGFSRTG